MGVLLCDELIFISCAVVGQLHIRHDAVEDCSYFKEINISILFEKGREKVAPIIPISLSFENVFNLLNNNLHSDLMKMMLIEIDLLESSFELNFVP